MLRTIATSIIVYMFSQSIASGSFNVIIKNKTYIIYNILSIFCFYSFLNIFLWHYEINFLITITLFYVISLTMYYVHEFRGTNINMSDILSLNTAKEVAGGYKYEIKPIFIFTFCLIILIYIYHIFILRIDFFKYYHHVSNVVESLNIDYYLYFWHEIIQILVFLISFYLLRDIISSKKYNYSIAAGEIDGYIYNFFSSIPIFLKRTDNLKANSSKENINNINTICPQNLNKINKKDDLPYVIVIMNESFGSVHRAIKTNIPVTPYYDAMKGVIKGDLYVNTFGGGTANTEFEFLTGMSIGNYRYPVMPYNNFVKNDKYSIARYFNAMGYNTIAMHPYTATNYHRDKVYKHFGFKELLFYEEFKHKECVRNFVSDASMYKEVIDRFNENVSNNKKAFIFGITMQNHSGYSSFKEMSVKADIDCTYDKVSLDSYLSLVKISDDAIRILIDYFKKVSEHVIILFFGDHNVSFGTKINKLLFSQNENYEFTNTYSTPFFIFDNREESNRIIKHISANFLILELIKKAKLPYDDNLKFLNTIYDEYSGYNFYKRISKDGKVISDILYDRYENIKEDYLKD